MNLEFALSKIPHHMREGAQAYVEHGQQPGGFLAAVLKNDLAEAGRRADDFNGRCLQGWACFLDNIPIAAWGSQDRINDWIAHKGLAGPEEQS